MFYIFSGMEKRLHCSWQLCKGACNAYTCEYRDKLNRQNAVYDQQHQERSRRQGNIFHESSTRGTMEDSFGSPVHSLEFHHPFGMADYRQSYSGGRGESADHRDRDAREEQQERGQRGRYNDYDRRRYSPPKNLER